MLPDATDYNAAEGLLRRLVGKDRKLIKRIWARWRPPLRMKVSEWAKKFRKLSRGATSEPGNYDPDRLPWQRFALDAVNDPKYTEHIWMGASQVMGKTEMINCVVGYFIHADPASILVKYPTKESGESWSKDKLAPAIADSPCLVALVGDARARDSGNTITHKKFPGGHLTVIGANSPSGLRQRSCRVVIQDEIDSDEGTAGNEGDSCALADKRAESFTNAVKIKSSTPTIKGASRICEKWEESTKHRRYVPCPKCDTWQYLKWEQVQWDKDVNEAGKVTKNHPETARYVCESNECGAHWTDIERQRAIMRGREVAENPTSKIFGMHIPGMYKLLGGKPQYSSMLEEFVEDYLAAIRGGKEKIKVWTNTFLCEPYEDQGESPIPCETIAARAEDYCVDAATANELIELPDGVVVLIAAVDCQEDRLECELVGFGVGDETWGIEYKIILGSPTARETWEALDAWLLKRWQHPSGAILAAAACGIDSGNKPEYVYKFVRARMGRRVFALKGSKSSEVGEPIVSRPKKSGVKQVPLFMIGTGTSKDMVYSRLRIPEAGPGFMHFPKNPHRGYDLPFYRGLVAETCVTKWSAGRKMKSYVNPSKRPNEPLDIRGYAFAVKEILSPDIDSLAAKLNAMSEPEIEAPALPDAPEKGGREVDMDTGKITPLPIAPPVKAEPPLQPANTYKKPEPVTPPQGSPTKPAAPTPQPNQFQRVKIPRQNFATRW